MRWWPRARTLSRSPTRIFDTPGTQIGWWWRVNLSLSSLLPLCNIHARACWCIRRKEEDGKCFDPLPERRRRSSAPDDDDAPHCADAYRIPDLSWKYVPKFYWRFWCPNGAGWETADRRMRSSSHTQGHSEIANVPQGPALKFIQHQIQRGMGFA